MGDDRPRIAVLVGREGLGDSVLKLPFLRALSRAYPGHAVWWIGSYQTAMADVLRPFTDKQVHTVLEHALPVEPARAVIPRLRRLPPFRIAFEARTHFKTVLLTRMFLRCDLLLTCLPGFMLSDRRPPGRPTRPAGVAERMLSMVEAATGKPADWRGTIEVGPLAESTAARLLPPGRSYVGLAPGSREAVKNWPPARFAQLACRLAAQGHVPVFLIGPQEREWFERLRADIPQAMFPEADYPDGLPGRPRLELAIALAARLAAAVANDSGIGHLLGAVGTPLVSLFGPTDPRRWAPVADRLKIVTARSFGGSEMSRIPVSAVLAALDGLLAEGRTGACAPGAQATLAGERAVPAGT